MALLKNGSLLLSALLFAKTALGADVCPAASGSSQKISDLTCIEEKLLPRCIEAANNFDSKEAPEKVITKLTKALSDDEMYTRLIFAESLASQCIDAGNVDSEKSQAIAQGIAWTLANRSTANKAKTYGVGRDVVTKEAQFRSSTGSCDVAKRVEFLCPEKAGAHWKSAWINAQKALEETKGGKNPLPQVYNYFFFKHFDKSVNCAKWKGKLPSWANPENQVDGRFAGLPKTDTCVQFFRER